MKILREFIAPKKNDIHKPPEKKCVQLDLFKDKTQDTKIKDNMEGKRWGS